MIARVRGRLGVSLIALAILVPAAVLAQSAPTSQDVLFALQDLALPLDGLQVRSAVRTDHGGSALLELSDGTLVDVTMRAAQEGWTVRGVALIAGSSDAFYSWSAPWRERVVAAENFIAGAQAAGRPTRSAEELAPLSWFEDPDEASRLWGMNPVTFRMMQTLQMLPALQGPTGGGTPTNPVPRRQNP